jgi:methylenetetrahydrofolate dehydrogenase (NADP+)/methenyltetrahydrofolate cyclohydrolase
MLLLAKPLLSTIQQTTTTYLADHGLIWKKVVIFLWSDDVASRVYVQSKQKYGQKLWLQVEVIQRVDIQYDEAVALIHHHNQDPTTIGMIIQLPLAEQLRPYQADLLTMVDVHKDIDGLWWVGVGRSLVGQWDFLPATPKSAVGILDHYGYGNVSGKIILVIGQSVLFGRPFALEMIKRGATVICGNSRSPVGFLQSTAQTADIIVSATGRRHLIDRSRHSSDWSEKVLIDVGYGIQDGKAFWDIDWEYFVDHVAAITPVPGGVGPMTVAALFHNIIDLQTF